MKEQIGFHYVQAKDGQRLIQRKSLAPGLGDSYHYPQANRHRAGLHPEDQDLEEEESHYVTRPHTSARRYTNVPTRITQGNTRYNVKHGAPPARQRTHTEDEEEEQPGKKGLRFHWLVYVGIALFIMIVGWIGLTALGQWWQGKQDDWQFGNPRTLQTDAVVGHNDSSSSPSHFTAENLRGQIIVVELPGGDATKGRSYVITSIPGNTGNPPVKVLFQDINHDGKLDMLVEIGDPGSVITVFLFNNGSQFVSKL